jgi:hypothetical protein
MIDRKDQAGKGVDDTLKCINWVENFSLDLETPPCPPLVDLGGNIVSVSLGFSVEELAR